MNRVELAISIASALAIVLCVGAFAFFASRNPMHERLAGFEAELAAVSAIDEEYTTIADVDFERLVTAIFARRMLWQQLVAPPAPPKRTVAPPNLEKMLKGVQISSRLELGRGDTVKVNVKTATSKRGEWKGVGDKVNGLEIVRITKQSVLFRLSRGGEEYVYTMRRQ